jgi:hypothetical protein
MDGTEKPIRKNLSFPKKESSAFFIKIKIVEVLVIGPSCLDDISGVKRFPKGKPESLP